MCNRFNRTAEPEIIGKALFGEERTVANHNGVNVMDVGAHKIDIPQIRQISCQWLVSAQGRPEPQIGEVTASGVTFAPFFTIFPSLKLYDQAKPGEVTLAGSSETPFRIEKCL